MFFLPHGGTGAELLFKSSPANDGEDGDYRSGKSPFSGLLYRNIPGQAASGANSDKPLPDDAVCVQYAAVFYCVYLYAFRKETFSDKRSSGSGLPVFSADAVSGTVWKGRCRAVGGRSSGGRCTHGYGDNLPDQRIG